MSESATEIRPAAEALAAAARDGLDLQAFAKAGFGDLIGIERLRTAGAVVMAANASPGEGDEPLLLADRALRRIERLFHRDDALAALYEMEQVVGSEPPTTLSPPARELVDGVVAEGVSLDEAIGRVSRGWRVERMPPVDRVVARMALWELRHRPATPTGVVIAEAVRLATAYSTARSGRFVNGVLSALVAEARPE